MNAGALDIARDTLEETARAIRDGQVSASAVLEAALACGDRWESAINALVSVDVAGARRAARLADEARAAGRPLGALHGVPIVIKDLIDVRGLVTSASSRVRAGHVASEDAHCVGQLRRAGAVIVAKSQTHEFAYGGITPQSRNPWDRARITGGSSGGSAAAVAVGEGLAGLGTDTAGSIRIPSALCGVVGLKPTYGRVSRRGVVPLSWSLDHVGPIARCVRDAALVLGVIAGRDPLERASAREPVGDYLTAIEAGAAGLRVGVPTNYFFDRCSEEVVLRALVARAALEEGGATSLEIRVPHEDLYDSAAFTIAMAEASEYHRESVRAHGPLYGADTRAKLEVGETILATDYLRASRWRAVMADAWHALFEEHRLDLVLVPTQPDVAAPVGTTEEQLASAVGDIDASLTRLVCPQNLTGLPALTLRSGFSAGLPVGVQLIGRPFDEATVLRGARVIERSLGGWAEGPFPLL